MKFLKKKEVKEAFKKAKTIEKEKLLTEKDISKIHKEGMKNINILQKLLSKTWFVSDKNNKSPTRNKKSSTKTL